ncbi:hypothetical protein ACEWY4_002156 [Coilia grayii]|uniref:Uncharacterized protein n=1 Tax=Coilia grayii TaxID=363190 RepID=A0ABD1KV03_9TELE
MWIFWFLACCFAARQNGGQGGEDKDLKKKVKKYKLDELKAELAALGVIVVLEEMDPDIRMSKKKVKRHLQKRLISELKKAQLVRANGFTFPMDIPEDVMDTLNDLDARLDKELEELDNDERKHDVQAVVHQLLDDVDTNEGLTLAGDRKHQMDGTTAVLESLILKGKKRVLRSWRTRDRQAEMAGQDVHFCCATEEEKKSSWAIPRKRRRC